MIGETSIAAGRGTVVFGQGGFVLHRLVIGAGDVRDGCIGRRTVEIGGYILPVGENEAAREAELARCRTLIGRIAADAAGFVLTHGGRSVRLYASQTPEFSSEVPLNGADAAYFTIRARTAEENGAFAGSAVTVLARGLEGALCFPLAITEGTVFGTLSHSGEVTVNNPGEIPVGFIAEITAMGGAITSLSIALGEEKIETAYPLPEDGVLTIDTRAGHKDVRADGASVLAYCDWRSSFFSLPPGESHIRWHCEGYGNARICVEFTPEFM